MKNTLFISLIITIFIAAVAMTVITAADDNSDESKYETRTEADTEPDLSYRDIDYRYPDINTFTADTLGNGTFTQDDLKDHDLTILYFWSATCGYCVNELPELAKLAEVLPSNVQIVTYCPEGADSPEMIKKILDRRGLDVITIISGDGDLEELINELFFTPTVLFLDSEGYMARKPYMGTPEDLVEEYNKMIDEVLETMGRKRTDQPAFNDN